MGKYDYVGRWCHWNVSTFSVFSLIKASGWTLEFNLIFFQLHTWCWYLDVVGCLCEGCGGVGVWGCGGLVDLISQLCRMELLCSWYGHPIWTEIRQRTVRLFLVSCNLRLMKILMNKANKKMFIFDWYLYLQHVRFGCSLKSEHNLHHAKVSIGWNTTYK